MPAGLDLRSVVVVLGVLDPAGSQGQFLHVLEVFVAGAVGANETAVFGITYVLLLGRGKKISRVVYCLFWGGGEDRRANM